MTLHQSKPWNQNYQSFLSVLQMIIQELQWLEVLLWDHFGKQNHFLLSHPG
uniref:Uncharacterized protein n=1 Tax=Arundo donax TaxID=35708 RepID=A0A0A9GRH7_ARUDO